MEIYGILCDGLYRANLDSSFSKSLLTLHVNVKVSSKRSSDNETSSMLWHKHLSHVSKERHESLVKDEVLPTLDFIGFGTCIYFIKGKQVKSTKKGTTRSTRLLGIVYIDIVDHFLFLI